jgi:hypothetical protein
MLVHLLHATRANSFELDSVVARLVRIVLSLANELNTREIGRSDPFTKEVGRVDFNERVQIMLGVEGRTEAEWLELIGAYRNLVRRVRQACLDPKTRDLLNEVNRLSGLSPVTQGDAALIFVEEELESDEAP